MAVTHIPSHLATGVFNHVDKPWESFAGRENGGPRSKGEPTDVWDSGGSPTDDPYRGLTPPISPAQVRGKADGKGRCLYHGRREKCICRRYLFVYRSAVFTPCDDAWLQECSPCLENTSSHLLHLGTVVLLRLPKCF